MMQLSLMFHKSHNLPTTNLISAGEPPIQLNPTSMSTLTEQPCMVCQFQKEKRACKLQPPRKPKPSVKRSSPMELPQSMVKSIPRLYHQPLIPMDLKFGIIREDNFTVTVREANRDVLKTSYNTKPGPARASVCFVVKRPGCVLCCEQGQALTQLLEEFKDFNVAAWAVIKDVGTSKDDLLDFYHNYFPYPFYRDEKQSMFAALGDRKVRNVLKMLWRFDEIRSRITDRKLRAKMQSSMVVQAAGMKLGGVIIFDHHGNIRYAHQEEFMDEFPMDEFREALRQVLKGTPAH